MTMLFLGEKHRSFSVTDAYKDTHVVPIGDNVELARNAATEKEYDCIFIDIEPFIDTPEKIAAVVEAISATVQSPIVIWAVNFSPQSNAVLHLEKAGINRFVFAQFSRKQKEEIEAAVNGTSTAQPVKTVSPVSEDIDKPSTTHMSPAERPPRSIAVFGSEARIGTTTAALQLCKYLTLCGYKPCYAEVSGAYTTAAVSTYKINATGTPERVMCGKLPLFNLQKTDISAITATGFDTVVYDCGNYKQGNFNEVFALDKDKRVLVCGAKPTEYQATIDAVKTTFSGDVWYLFNFIAENEQNGIRSMMAEKGNKTLFMPSVPNPYAYSSKHNNVYGTIARVNTTAAPRAGLFKRLFSKGKRRNAK
jgi:hypothetical protein